MEYPAYSNLRTVNWKWKLPGAGSVELVFNGLRVLVGKEEKVLEVNGGGLSNNVNVFNYH